MKIISSQRFLNNEIVDEKVMEMTENDTNVVVLPIINAEMEDLDGNALYVLVDGHHRKEAAEILGIKVEYNEIKNYYDLTGEELLIACWNDSDWYYIDNGNIVW